MWKITYDLLSLLLSIPYCVYILLLSKTRGSLIQRIFPQFKRDGEKIWIHAASLGEASLSHLLVNFLKSEKQELDFVLTTNTNYAREFLRDRLKDFEVLPSPIDVSFIIRRFLKKGRIKTLILIETELWPNMIWETKKIGGKVLLVNARLSERSFRGYRALRRFIGSVLKEIDHIFAQSTLDMERFVELGADPERVTLFGNMKYLAYEEVKGVSKERAITFGSVREREIPGVIEVIVSLSKKYGDIRFFIAPREKDKFSEVFDRMKDQIQTERYSVVKKVGSQGERVIVVDTFGDLKDLYARSLISFVGGSLFPYGGHNPLEPLIYGTPVLFGPHVENFKEICGEIVRSNVGFMVEDFSELKRRIEELLENDELRRDMGERGRRLLKEKKSEIESGLKRLIHIL